MQRARLLLAGVVISIHSGMATAQPSVYTDLGSHTLGETFSQSVTLGSASDIQWFKIVLPGVTAAGGYVDIWTNTPGNITDSEIGLYSNTGVLEDSDDDDGPGTLSQLSYGQTSPARAANGSGLTFTGQDGSLTAGAYWLAVGCYDVTFDSTGWIASSSYSGSQRTITLNLRIQPAPVPSDPIGSGTVIPSRGLIGSTFLARVMVTPGTNPPSTGISVQLNASNVNGGMVALHDDGVYPDATAGDNVFSENVTVGPSAECGAKLLSFTVTDSQIRTGTGNSLFLVLTPAGRPVVYTDLGTHISTETFSQSVTLTSGTDIQWFKIVLPNANSADGYVDIWVNVPGNITNSEIGLYADNGALEDSDDDDGPGGMSQLSYGLLSPTRPANTTGSPFDPPGLTFAGQDGPLVGGTYWLAVGLYDVAFEPGCWGVTSTPVLDYQRTTKLNFRILPGAPPSSPTGTGASTPTSGAVAETFVARVTVTPGANPASTGLTVSLNAASVDGGTIALLDNGVAPDTTSGDNVFSGNVTIGANATVGNKTLTFVVADAQNRSSSGFFYFAVTPANDDCAEATEVGEGVFGWDNALATTDETCGCVSPTNNDVWFRYTPTFTGLQTLSLCGTSFGTVLSVFNTCNGSELACDQGSCYDPYFSGSPGMISNLPVTAGVPLLLRIASLGGGPVGAGTLSIFHRAMPAQPDIVWIASGHADSVNSVAVSPDGLTIASGSSDKTIKLWRAADLSYVRTLTGHNGEVRSVAFSPDGQMLASVSAGQGWTAKLWRVSDGALLHSLHAPEIPFPASLISFRPDGLTVLTFNEGGDRYDVWRVADGALLTPDLVWYGSGVMSLSVAPDGASFASGSYRVGSPTPSIFLYEGLDIRFIPSQTGPQAHSSPIVSLAYSPDGQTIVSGSVDQTAKLWQVSTGALLIDFTDFTGYVLSVAFSPDGLTLATAAGGWNSGGGYAYDHRIKLWRISDGALLQTLADHTLGVNSVAFAPDGQSLVSGSDDRTLRQWRTVDGAPLRTVGLVNDRVNCLAFSHNGQILCTGERGPGSIKLWGAAEGGLESTIANSYYVISASFSPDGQTLATAGDYEDVVSIWRVSDGALLQTLAGHTLDVNCVAFSPDGLLLASGSDDRTVKIWRVADGALLRTLTGHADGVRCLEFSPDGQLMASSGGLFNGSGFGINLWRVSDGALLRTLAGHSSTVTDVDFSPDGLTLASSGGDLAVKVWRVADGAPLWNTLHADEVTSVAFSPDGRMLMSAGFDGIIAIWQASDGSLRKVYGSETGTGVTSIAYASNGSVFAYGRDDAPIAVANNPFYCPGDLNGSLGVELGDLAIVLSQYGTTSGANYLHGDLDGDGDVDLGDLAMLLSIYGANCPG